MFFGWAPDPNFFEKGVSSSLREDHPGSPERDKGRGKPIPLGILGIIRRRISGIVGLLSVVCRDCSESGKWIVE